MAKLMQEIVAQRRAVRLLSSCGTRLRTHPEASAASPSALFPEVMKWRSEKAWSVAAWGSPQRLVLAEFWLPALRLANEFEAQYHSNLE
jgi:uncharacterized protein YceK